MRQVATSKEQTLTVGWLAAAASPSTDLSLAEPAGASARNNKQASGIIRRAGV